MVIMHEYRMLLEETERRYDRFYHNEPIQTQDKIDIPEKEYNVMLSFINRLTIEQCKLLLKEIEKGNANFVVSKDQHYTTYKEQNKLCSLPKRKCKVCGKEVGECKRYCDKCLNERKEERLKKYKLEGYYKNYYQAHKRNTRCKLCGRKIENEENRQYCDECLAVGINIPMENAEE